MNFQDRLNRLQTNLQFFDLESFFHDETFVSMNNLVNIKAATIPVKKYTISALERIPENKFSEWLMILIFLANISIGPFK